MTTGAINKIDKLIEEALSPEPAKKPMSRDEIKELVGLLTVGGLGTAYLAHNFNEAYNKKGLSDYVGALAGGMSKHTADYLREKEQN